MPHWLIAALIIGWLVYVGVVSVWVIMQRSEPVATLGWLMALAFLPYVGFIVYYVLGPQRIRRSGLRREAAHAAIGARGKSNVGDEADVLSRMAQTMTGYPRTTASRVDLLVDGGATYDALAKAIASSQHHVHVEYYIYAGDRTGLRIRDALIERAKAGVKVRMLLDGVGSKLARKFAQPLHDAGVELAFLQPVSWWAVF
jgi:cardiolipin synthase